MPQVIKKRIGTNPDGRPKYEYSLSDTTKSSQALAKEKGEITSSSSKKKTSTKRRRNFKDKSLSAINKKIEDRKTSTKSLDDFGGNISDYKQYLMDNKGEGTPQDLDNLSGVQLSPEEKKALDALRKVDEQNNMESGGTADNKSGAYLDKITRGKSGLIASGFNEASAQSLQSGMTEDLHKTVKAAQDPSNFTNPDTGEIDKDAWIQSLLNASSMKVQTAEDQYAIAGNEAQSNIGNAPELDMPTEEELAESVLGKELFDSYSSKKTRLEDKFEAEREELRAIQAAEQRRAKERERRSQMAAQVSSGGIGANVGYLVGIAREGDRALQEQVRKDNFALNSLIREQDAILEQLEDEKKDSFRKFVAGQQQEAVNIFNADLAVWKEHNDKEMDYYKEQNKMKEANKDDQRADMKFLIQEERFAQQNLSDDLFKLYKETNGNVAAGALAEYFAEQGIPVDVNDLMEATTSNELISKIAENPYYMAEFLRLPSEARKFIIDELPEEADRVRLGALQSVGREMALGNSSAGSSGKTGAEIEKRYGDIIADAAYVYLKEGPFSTKYEKMIDSIPSKERGDVSNAAAARAEIIGSTYGPIQIPSFYKDEINKRSESSEDEELNYIDL